MRKILGIDEAGRGPLAGPVYVAGVIFNEDRHLEGLNDSKKLNDKQREKLFDVIINSAIAYTIIAIDNIEIDKVNILQATMNGMRTVAEKLKPHCYDIALVDGNRYPLGNIKGEAVIKGDSKISAIMAASILAKVSRDRYMLKLHEEFPVYEFDKHKGYPTKRHKELIALHGPCKYHRTTFRGVKEHLQTLTLFE